MSFFGRLFGSAARARYRCAMRAFDAGDYEAAHADFQRALAAGAPPGDPILHLAAFYAAEAATHLGRRALQAGAPARALVWLEPVLHGGTASPAVLELAALAYLERDALDNCLACLQAWLILDPGRAEAQLLAVVVCHARGDASMAQACLEAARGSASSGISDAVRRVLVARAQQSAALAELLRDFLPSPLPSGV